MYSSERGSTGLSSIRVFQSLSGGKMPLPATCSFGPGSGSAAVPASGLADPASGAGVVSGTVPPVGRPRVGMSNGFVSGPALQARKRKLRFRAVRTKRGRCIEGGARVVVGRGGGGGRE